MGSDKPRAKQIAIKMGKKSRAMAEGTASLGAAKDCLYRVSGAGINDHHVNLEFNGTVITVSATQEAESITINGKPLTKPQQVKSGDIIAFGNHSFEIGAVSNAPGAFRRALRLWYIRWPLYAAGSLAALLLLVFLTAWIYLSPDRISGWITEAVDKNLNCKSSVGSLDYTFGGHVVITDFQIQNKPEYANTAILKIGKMEAQVSVWDILSSKLRLNFTATDPVLDLQRKLIAGRPSWNFEPLLPPPGPPAPPSPALDLSQPIDIGLVDLQINIATKNLVIHVNDELMKRKTKVTVDWTAVTDGGGQPLNFDITCLVDSNGRSGKIAFKADANSFDKQGRLDLSTASPDRLVIRPGDMVNSLPLQALIDHSSLPMDKGSALTNDLVLAKDRTFTEADLPMEPNLMGKPLTLTVTWTDPRETDPAKKERHVDVNLAHLEDLSVNWSVLTVRSFEPLAVDVAGTIDLTGVAKHRSPWPALTGVATETPDQPLPAPGGATPVAAAAEWIEGDKIHIDLNKISLDTRAQTVAVDAAVTLSNAKLGQILKAQVTTSAAQFDLKALTSQDKATQQAAIRKIKWDHPLAKVDCDAVALVGSSVGRLALVGREQQFAGLKSGSVSASLSVDGDLSQSLHLIGAIEVKNITYALSPESSIDKGGLNVTFDANLGLTSDFMPEHADVATLRVDCGLGGKNHTLCEFRNVKTKGLGGLMKGDISHLSVTADKLQPLMISREFAEQINPLLKSTTGVELHDLIQITGEGDLADMKGSVNLHGRIERIDPERTGLSAEARQPITFEIRAGFRQLDEKKKQVTLDISGQFGEPIFHTGLETPPFDKPDELATAPMSFTEAQAPSLHLPIARLVERARAYLAGNADLLAKLDLIDMSANPQLVLQTKKLTVNQPGAAAGELQARWEFSLGLINILDTAVAGKTILPEKTAFNFDFKLNPAYTLTASADGAVQLKSLRLDECSVDLKNKFCAVQYDLVVSDLLPLQGRVEDANAPEGFRTDFVRLPAILRQKGHITVQKEAYQLARELVKDRIILLSLTKDQQALVVDLTHDWNANDPAQHDTLSLRLETQVDPFHVETGTAGERKTSNLLVTFKATNLFQRIKLPFDAKSFDAIDFVFKSNAALDITTPLSIDQLILLLHQNALTLHLDQNELLNTINSPVSPISAGGTVQSEIHVQFDGQGSAQVSLRADLTDLYLQVKNEDPFKVVLVKEKQKLPLFLHETRAKNPQTEPLVLALAATAKREGNLLTIRLDDKENIQRVGPVTVTLGATVTAGIDGHTVTPQKADFNKEIVLDFAQIAGVAPLATDLHLDGRLHVKTTAQGLDLARLTAPQAAASPAAPVVPVPAAPAGVPPAPAPSAAATTATPPPPFLDPNLNTSTYEMYTAPDLTIQPKGPQKNKLSLGLKNFAGDLGGNKSGDIVIGLEAAHTTAIRLTDLRAVGKPEAPSFLQALETFALRVNAKVANEQPIHLLEWTSAAQACTRALGLPEPPPAPATPPPAGTPLQPGALDFLEPLTANFEVDLRNILYDRYEVDGLKGKIVLDQGSLQMPEPPTARIYGGTAKVDVTVQLTGPNPNIPKILMDIADIDYNDFFTRAYAAPKAVAGKMQVHIEGTGKSALAPDIDSLNLQVITTKSEGTEITDITKVPLLGPLWVAAAEMFPTALPANPGPIPLGTQLLKNGKLENGYFIFSEFPFNPTEGPLMGYTVVGEGKIHVMTAHAEQVTFKVTAVPKPVLDTLVATTRKEVLEQANKLITNKKYALTDADLDEADKDMRARFQQFLADGKLFVRGRGPLSRPTPEMTSPKEVSNVLFQVGMTVAKKKVTEILKQIAAEQAKDALHNLIDPKKKK